LKLAVFAGRAHCRDQSAILQNKPERKVRGGAVRVGLFVRFADGLTGEVRFTHEHLTGVFQPLKDAVFFKQMYLDHGAVAWPGQIDLAPDAMYMDIKAKGVWVLA
jgi:Protein of unknown function (DUF2442)